MGYQKKLLQTSTGTIISMIIFGPREIQKMVVIFLLENRSLSSVYKLHLAYQVRDDEQFTSLEIMGA